jgi:hypothetical protein
MKVTNWTGAPVMRFPHMTIRRWMIAVAVVAVLLAVRDELVRMRLRRLDAELRQLDRALREFRLKHPEWRGCHE